MAGRPKRRARLAAQWAEVDRAAGRTSNAGRPKRRARLAAEAAARGAVSAPAAASVPSAHLTDLIAARDAAADQCRRAEKNHTNAKREYRAAQRNDNLDAADYMDAEREYYNTVGDLEDARRHLAEINKALAAARRTPNAGRPKRRARIAAQWAEVDRLAGVKVPRKRKANPDLAALRAEARAAQAAADAAWSRREVAREAMRVAIYNYTRSGRDRHAETLRLSKEAGTAYRTATAEFDAAHLAAGLAKDAVRAAEAAMGSKRKANGGLPSGWRLFKDGKRPSAHWNQYALVSMRPDKYGSHVYCMMGGKYADEWAVMDGERFAEEAQKGFGWFGTEIDFDAAPAAIRENALRRIRAYEDPSFRQGSESRWGSMNERLAAKGWKPPARKRNGQRYRVFESRGVRLHGRDLMLVDTEAHEGYYQIMWLGVDDSGHDDVGYTEVQAFGRAFDPADYTVGREIPLDKIPARFRQYVQAHIAKG